MAEIIIGKGFPYTTKRRKGVVFWGNFNVLKCVGSTLVILNTDRDRAKTKVIETLEKTVCSPHSGSTSFRFESVRVMDPDRNDKTTTSAYFSYFYCFL